MRRLLVRAGVVVVVALFVFMLGLVGLMFLEDAILAANEPPPGVVCTVIG